MGANYEPSDLRNLTDTELAQVDIATVLIQEKGTEHERRYLASLKRKSWRG